MDMFSKKFDTMHDLFVHELKGLYDAEHQIIESLPKMKDAATASDLKKAFEQHLEMTRQQAVRLEDVFDMLDMNPERHHCDGIAGIIKEADMIAKSQGNADVRDAGLIAVAQKVEHYEIATYGTLRTWAQEMGHDDVADILQRTLSEESSTDKELTGLAEGEINIRAPGM